MARFAAGPCHPHTPARYRSQGTHRSPPRRLRRIGSAGRRRLEQRYERARQMAGVLPTGARRGSGRNELALFWSLRADALRRAGASAAWRPGRMSSARCGPSARGCSNRSRDPVGADLCPLRAPHASPARSSERLVHIGDAWHSASPQLGQGANMALLDAWALAQALGGEGPLDARLATAVALRRSHVRLYQWLTALFTPAYQSDSRLAGADPRRDARPAVAGPAGAAGAGEHGLRPDRRPAGALGLRAGPTMRARSSPFRDSRWPGRRSSRQAGWPPPRCRRTRSRASSGCRSRLRRLSP